MAGVLPSNVSFFMQRLQGVSTSSFLVRPQSNDSATANKILRFELPSNSLINFRSIRLMCNAGFAGTTNSEGGRLPNGLYKLIERVAIYMGGTLVQNNFQAYNLYQTAKESLEGSKCDSVSGHPEIVRKTSYHDGSTLVGDANEDYADKDDQFAIAYWEGLLGSIQPSILDLGSVPQVTVEITLAEDAVCPTCAGTDLDGFGTTDITDVNTSTAAYSLSNISMQMEVLGMATSVLDQILEQRIASVGYISLPFTNVFTYVSTHSGTSRFSVNSASWDRLWITYRPTTFSNRAGAHRVPGYKKSGGHVVVGGARKNGATSGTTVAFDEAVGDAPIVGDTIMANDTAGDTFARVTVVDSATQVTVDAAITLADDVALKFIRDVGLPAYDTGGSLDTNKEKYISNFFRMKEPSLTTSNVPATYQLQINGATVPAFRANRNEMYEITRNSVDSYHIEHDMSLNQYVDSYFVQCMRFCLPDSQMSRLASGLDTRSVSAQAAVETTGFSENCNLTVFAECTSELRVGSGRAISVIV